MCAHPGFHGLPFRFMRDHVLLEGGQIQHSFLKEVSWNVFLSRLQALQRGAWVGKHGHSALRCFHNQLRIEQAEQGDLSRAVNRGVEVVKVAICHTDSISGSLEILRTDGQGERGWLMATWMSM